MSNVVHNDDASTHYQKIESNVTFEKLVRQRSVFAWVLSSIMLGSYCSFILLLAYAPKFVGTPIFEGGSVTYGIPMGIGLILLAIALSGIYVYKANGDFDRLNQEVVEALKDMQEIK